MDTTPAKTVAKAGGLGSFLILAVTQLPDPYASWVAYLLMASGLIGLVATQIPAPKVGSKWTIPYTLLSYLASNWAKAANIAIMLRSGHHNTTNTKG